MVSTRRFKDKDKVFQENEKIMQKMQFSTPKI